jgi:hypothetical protein
MNIYTPSDLNNIKKIQHFYFKKKFITNFKKKKHIFNNLFNLINRDNINNINNNFDNITMYIRKKDIIKDINIILKNYYRMLNNISSNNNDVDVISFQINSRIFLSSFIIYGFPEFSLSIKKNDIDVQKKNDINYDIYKLSEEFIINIKKFLENSYDTEILRKFIKSINMYSNCFMMWINNDKINKINELYYEWHAIQETINDIKESDKYDDDQQKNTIKTLNDSQNNLIKFIKKINPNFDIKYLKIFSSLSFQLKQNFEKSYWDLLKIDLEKKELSSLKKILIDIQNNIISLRKKNSKFIDDFKEQYDIELIIQIIENNLFCKEYLLNYSEFIINNIINMQAPIRNKNTIDEWTIIKNNIEIMDMNDTVPIVLKFILNNINDIKKDILNLQILNSLK